MAEEAVARARYGDPDTSHEAAASIDAEQLRRVIHDAIVKRGDLGATWDELVEITGLARQSISPRFVELRGESPSRLPVLIERRFVEGKRIARPGASGRSQTVWFAASERKTSVPQTEDTGHSTLVGGSTAARRLACPASYQMESKLPEAIRNASSSYADEGTALHECVAYCLRENLLQHELDDKLLGMEFGGFVMTREMLDDAIVPCLDFIDGIDLDDEGDLELLIETKVVMPGIPGAFGTADVIARTTERTIMVDWKFGVGVPVSASYDGEPNAQLAYYARAAMHTCPTMFGHQRDEAWPIDMFIVQPRVRGGVETVSHCRVTQKKLESFRIDLLNAVSEARGPNPRINRGDHCRFAPCKTICPKFTGPALDLTKLHSAMSAKKGSVLGGIDIDWPALYSELLTLADMAELVTREIRTQAHVFMQDGNTVPGYKLVQKRADLKWNDDQAKMQAAQAARDAGCYPSEIMTDPDVRSPAQVRDAIANRLPGTTKVARKEAAEEIVSRFAQRISSGTTIAHEDDSRESVIPASGQLMRLAAKLVALTGGK